MAMMILKMVAEVMMTMMKMDQIGFLDLFTSDDSEECRSSSGDDCRKDDDFDGAHFSSGNVPNVEITVNDSSDDVFDMRPIFLAVLEENETITPKTNPKVDVPGGGVIYKSTLVSLLNEDPLLSHDKQRQQYKEKDPLTETEERVVQLFSDYAVLDKPNQSYKIGQVVRITNQGKNSSTNYKLPVPYDHEIKKNIIVTFQMHKKISNETHVYSPVYSTLRLPFDDIITHINDTINGEGNLQLCQNEHNEIMRLISRNISHTKKRNTPDEDSLTSVTTNDHDDHDEIRTVVRLSPSEDGIRRSQRVKTVKWFL